MSDNSTPTALPGSIPPPRPLATPAGALDPSSDVEATVYLRPRPHPADAAGAPRRAGEAFLSRAGLATTRGAAPDDVSAVEDFARSHALRILEVDPAARRVRLGGTAGAMAAAFGVQFQQYEHPDGRFRSHSGPVLLPPDLADVVVAVLGLDDRPQADTRYRLSKDPASSYTPLAIARMYGAQSGATASGVVVALIELGGGYTSSDLDAYFTALGLAPPTVTAAGVDGASNQPTGSASGPDTEVMLDIEVVGAIARGADIVVYFAPNTDQGFADAISAAVHDTTHSPDIISISWGGPESTYSPQTVSVFEAALTDAASVGVSVFVAAGDNGSSDGVNDGEVHVDYPASSPHVVGCGGTHVEVSNAAVTSEVVWNDLSTGGATGGGVSAIFRVPAWQTSAGVPPSAAPGASMGRGVPDVAADADPESGYQIRVDGDDIVVGGTSAVAPLYAGLTALAIAQAGRPFGLINPLLYSLSDQVFRDITLGNNGAYHAGVGWDPCTGWGSPRAADLIAALVDSAKKNVT
ncbi:MAG: S53 family peptidase [Acidimicrobiales bacterium]